MNVSILTFQFAHNYGALLQAYALKDHLTSLGHCVRIAPYFPAWAQTEYTINPFAKGVPPKRRIRLALQYRKRKKQSHVFNRFISEELEIGETFSSEGDLQRWLDNFDCVVCGSDQIWNNHITGKGAAYFASECHAKKISYAASLGTISLTEEQKHNILLYLPEFAAISVREPGSALAIEELIARKISVVLDPVFLIGADVWGRLGSPVEVKPKYMFLYFLQENEELLGYAKEYANENDLQIYDVHPTTSTKHTGCIRLNNIGPKEFIWLIQNAACVCTNSFHATAFSLIFKKRLIHIPNSKSPERTISLLNRAGIDLKEKERYPLYDLNKCDFDGINRLIEESKKFIDLALKL